MSTALLKVSLKKYIPKSSFKDMRNSRERFVSSLNIGKADPPDGAKVFRHW